MKRYGILLLAFVALGVLSTRVARRGPDRPAGDAVDAVRARVPVTLMVHPDGRVTPGFVSVPKDHEIELRVLNRHGRRVTLTLLGYEDRLGPVRVAADSTWKGALVADRPGEDFAWMLDGTPVARLRVTGSHLVEGHR